ncbi:MAG: MFS transporter, partial [Pseudomonadota bacterium]|nr:MFS transporter [Pseudomonadota bacterium]
LLPLQLVNQLDLPVTQHGWLYLPLLLLGFVLAIPAIIVAEAKRRMRRIFIGAVGLISLSLLVLTVCDGVVFGVLLGIGLFFIAFNLIEALLPSWVAKRAPVASRATAMGVNASSQFLGAFVGGVLGGQLLTHVDTQMAWGILALLCLVWFYSVFQLVSPPYLSSLAVRLPSVLSANHRTEQEWMSCLLAIDGVEDVVVLLEQRVAYLKIDRRLLGDVERQNLSQILQQPIAV